MTGQNPASDGDGAAQVQAVMDELLVALGADRCTLRLDVPGDYGFPVISEALAGDVPSIKDFVELPQYPSPTYDRIARERDVVVMDDCEAASTGADAEYTNAYFRELMAHYGGMAAFIAAPVYRDDGTLVGVISVHQLGRPRRWDDSDVAHARAAVHRVRASLPAFGLA